MTSLASLQAAEAEVRRVTQPATVHPTAGGGRLDALINNASVAAACEVFLPLLRSSSRDPRIVQVSSTRGSLAYTEEGRLPPPRALSYCASKAALNLVTMLMSQREESAAVLFQCASPGHCRTDFNGNTGARDPEVGAEVIVDMVLEDRELLGKCGLWEVPVGETEKVRAPW